MSEKQNTLINCICVLISFSTIYGMDPCIFRSYGNKLRFGALDVRLLFFFQRSTNWFVYFFFLPQKNQKQMISLIAKNLKKWSSTKTEHKTLTKYFRNKEFQTTNWNVSIRHLSMCQCDEDASIARQHQSEYCLSLNWVWE